MTRRHAGYGEIRDPDTLEFIRCWGAAIYLTEDIPWTGDERSIHIGHPMWVEDSDSIAFSYRGWCVMFEQNQSVLNKSRWELRDPQGNYAVLTRGFRSSSMVHIVVLLRVANWMAHHGWAPGWEDHVVPAT